jgi:WD40 repeat protein
MFRRSIVFTLLLVICALQAPAGLGQAPLKDLHGDPLPAGAQARLGTIRWVHRNAEFAAFLPDGKTVVTAGGDPTIRFWEFPSGKEMERRRITLRAVPESGFSPFGSTPSVAVTRDGKTIAAYIGGAEICLHNLTTGKELPALKWEAPAAPGKKGFGRGGVAGLNFSPSGEHLAVLQNDGSMRIWDWATTKEIHQYIVNADGGAFIYAPDGKSIATIDTSGNSGVVKLWNAANGALTWRFKPKDNDDILDIAFSPDGKALAVCGDDAIYLVDPATGKQIRKLPLDVEPENLAFSKDGTKLYASGYLRNGNQLVELDLATGKVLRECAGREGKLSLSPDAATLVLTDSGGNGPIFFGLAAGQDMAALFPPTSPLRSVHYLLDGRSLLTISSARQGNQALQKWDAASGKELGPVPLPLTLTLVAASPDGKLLAGQDRGGPAGFGPIVPSKEIDIFDASSGKGLGKISLQSAEPQLSAGFSPDGKTLALGQPVEGKIELYGVDGLKLRLTLAIAKAPGTGKVKGFGGMSVGPPGTIAFSPDGKLVATLADANTMGLWDTATGKRIGSLSPAPGKGGFTGSATFSPDCRCLALQMKDGTAAMYELSTSQPRRSFGKPQAALELPFKGFGPFAPEVAKAGSRFAFAPDGRSIVQGGSDKIISMWDVLHEREPVKFKGHLEAIAGVAFAPDGKAFASASADGTALIWDVTKVKRPAVPPQSLKPGDLETWWQALAGADAVKAFAAIGQFAAAPEESVAWIKERLKPASGLDEKRIQELIAQLGDKEFKMRFQAASELLRIGEQIIPTLGKVLSTNPPAELKTNLEKLLSEVTPGLALQDEPLRGYRAVEALEFIGTPQARQVLETLAGGAPGALLTRSARAALKR